MTKLKTDDFILVFRRLVADRMQKSEVNLCLAASQQDFLSVLMCGLSDEFDRDITRAEFARLVGISTNTAYSYFASPGAKDYRNISEDMRISFIWKTTNAIETKIPGGINQILRDRFYIVNGEKMTLRKAAVALNYSHANSLSDALKKHGVKYGDDISHLKNPRSRLNGGKHFIVDGKVMNGKESAAALGYKTYFHLCYYLKKAGIVQGDDISFLRREPRDDQQNNQ